MKPLDVFRQIQDSGHDCFEKAVLLAILRRVDNDTMCGWVVQPDLARLTSMTDRGVRKVLHRLEAAGAITITRKLGCKDRAVLHPERLATPEPRSDLTPEPRSEVTDLTPEPGSDVPRNPVPGTPEPRSDELPSSALGLPLEHQRDVTSTPRRDGSVITTQDGGEHEHSPAVRDVAGADGGVGTQDRSDPRTADPNRGAGVDGRSMDDVPRARRARKTAKPDPNREAARAERTAAIRRVTDLWAAEFKRTHGGQGYPWDLGLPGSRSLDRKAAARLADLVPVDDPEEMARLTRAVRDYLDSEPWPRGANHTLSTLAGNAQRWLPPRRAKRPPKPSPAAQYVNPDLLPEVAHG